MSEALQYKELGETILHEDSTWILIISLACLVTLGFVRTRSSVFISQLLSLLTSTFNWRTVEDSANMQERSTIRILNAVCYISISLIAYESIVGLRFNDEKIIRGFDLYLAILVGLLLFFMLKRFLNAAISYAFDIPEAMRNVGLCRTLSTNILALISVPLAMIFPFISERAYIPLVVVVVVLYIVIYLWRLTNTMRIIIADFLSLFYTFLYLCTVEALPIVCIAKFATIALR